MINPILPHQHIRPAMEKEMGKFPHFRVMSGKMPKISLVWLGDLDSNQGCPGQSREFYR
jgi:hypothetical protein